MQIILITIAGPQQSVDLEVPGEIPISDLLSTLLEICEPQPTHPESLNSFNGANWGLITKDSLQRLDSERSLTELGIVNGRELLLEKRAGKKCCTIGKYWIIENIASSEIGGVYRAEESSISSRYRPVRINLLHTTLLSSAQERQRFLQGAQLLATLKHPFMLPILEVGIDEDVPYLVMEYTPHGSLSDRLKEQAPRPLSIQEGLTILAQVGQALHYAHEHNIIHGDLKPANILFNAMGEALLADCGIATLLTSGITQGTAIGASPYMASEQFHGILSKEGDQYALGCIAYELFTGRVPFTSPDFYALGYKHMPETPMPPTQLNLLLPRSLEQAILKAIAKQRTERYPDMDAFLAALGAPSITSTYLPSPLPEPPPPIAMLRAAIKSEQARGPFSGIGAHVNAITQAVRDRLSNRHLGTNGNGLYGKVGGRRHALFIAATIPLLLLLLTSGTLFTMPSIFKSHPNGTPASQGTLRHTPAATVTITPAKKELSRTYLITAVTGTPDASRQQVGARLLSSPTRRQSKTVQATGKGIIPATQASGQVTFYGNGSKSYTFPPGYTIPTINGMTAVVSHQFTIYPGSNGINVNASISTAGSQGNIPAGYINISCCYNYDGQNGSINFLNAQPFTGGKDATNYTFVQGSDINTAVKQMQDTLASSAQAAVLKQVQPQEKLLGPVQCPPKVTSDHGVGENVAKVTINVTVTCTGEVYDQQAAVAMANNLLTQEIASAPDRSYILSGKLTVSVMQANIVDPNGTLALLVKATDTIVFQFSLAQRQELAWLIAGKSELDAQIILMRQPGIGQAIIRVYGNTGYMLPGNLDQITIIILS